MFSVDWTIRRLELQHATLDSPLQVNRTLMVTGSGHKGVNRTQVVNAAKGSLARGGVGVYAGG